MPVSSHSTTDFIQRHYLRGADLESLAQRLRAKPSPPPHRVPGGARLTPEVLEKRWRFAVRVLRSPRHAR